MFFGHAFRFICRQHDKELTGYPSWNLISKPEEGHSDKFVIDLAHFRCSNDKDLGSECIEHWEATMIPIRAEMENSDITDYTPPLVDDFAHESDIADWDDKVLDTEPPGVPD